MSHATPWQRAAEQLHTAAADVVSIAAQRERATGQRHTTSSETVRCADFADSRPVHPDGQAGAIATPPVATQGSDGPASAHPARVYAYWLGGKDHHEIDRVTAEEVIRLRPQVVAGARANRRFGVRVVRYLAAECGIRQFLDIGTGLPAPGNTHEVAQRIDPACRVVYADNDPVVLAHARALLTSTPPGICGYLNADLRDPAAILTQAARTLDLSQPVAVLLLAVLHFVADADDPATIVATLANGIAPGSFIAVSHVTADFAPEQVTAAAAAYNALAVTPIQPRTHSEITGLFGGLALVPPGVVPVTEWRPQVAPLPQRHTADLYAGVARVRQGHR